MTSITKTEEASELFNKENINIQDSIQEVAQDLNAPLTAHTITIKNNIPDTLNIEDNKTLIYAIFCNLIKNSINYAGEHIHIYIDNYTEDNEFYYFPTTIQEKGVEEEHLERPFERFIEYARAEADKAKDQV